MVTAFSLRGHAQFFPITGFVGLPLTFMSSALVPLSLMPDSTSPAWPWRPGCCAAACAERPESGPDRTRSPGND